MAMKSSLRPYVHPLYESLLEAPGLSVVSGALDELLTWGAANSLWVFPMATSCCGIEFMAAAASRVDLDRMGTIVRATPRQADVMVVAGTITVKMAPRVKKLWEQMPEPKWCVAMGSCAISGDFYRDLYPVVPGIDTFLPVDVYVPGCPPNPEDLMHGLLRLQEKIRLVRAGKWTQPEQRAETEKMNRPAIRRWYDEDRCPSLTEKQLTAAGAFTDDERAGAPEPRRLPVVADAAPSEHKPEADPDGALVQRLGEPLRPEDVAVSTPPFVETERHVELARTLQSAGYELLAFIVATHFSTEGEGGDAYEVAYGLRSTGPGSTVVSWRVRVPVDQPVPSLSAVFAGADWQEREQYDLLGVVFEGHPDLRRILLPPDWSGHPLRRDYPTNAEHSPWR